MLYSFSHKFNNQVEKAKKKRTEGGKEALGNYRAFIPFYKMGSLLQILCSQFNPLHHILHTVLCTFPKMLTRRICLLIKSFFSW